jgi:V8-like Glu-specific endopeptidase
MARNCFRSLTLIFCISVLIGKGSLMLKSWSLAVLTMVSFGALAAPPVIYGDDNRLEVYEASPAHQALAASAATMIDSSKISSTPGRPGILQIEQTTLRSWLESQLEEKKSDLLSKSAQNAVDQKISFCEGERFTEQPNAGSCSGFLVGPDLLVTAGHCVVLPDFCENYKWVFDFKVDADSKMAGVDVKEKDVYSCKKVISHAVANSLGLDYGLIQLDRKVKGRPSLSVRTQGKVNDAGELVVIGSPSGLPLKVAAGSSVRTNVHPFFFSANLDTFQGNSGSAVFNAKTGVVEGILVRGEEDFEANTALMCIEAKRCDDSSCRGEDVSRMTSIPEFAVKDALFRMAKKGNVGELEKLMEIHFWIDIYGSDGRTALMKAAMRNRQDFVKKLIEKNADVKIQDAFGNSALHLIAGKLSEKNAGVLKVILAAGADLEARNDLLETPLLAAARALNLDAVKILIKYGAERNALNGKNENVLFAFARKNKKRAIQELVAMGVDQSVINSDGVRIEDLKKPCLLATSKKSN